MLIEECDECVSKCVIKNDAQAKARFLFYTKFFSPSVEYSILLKNISVLQIYKGFT